jgi:hypothetical protein
MKAVEEQARTETHGVFIPTGSNRRRKVGDVTRDELGIEAKLLDAYDRVVGAELLTKRVDPLRDRAPGTLVIGIGPDERGDFLSRDATVTGACKQGEKGESPRLPSRACNSPFSPRTQSVPNVIMRSVIRGR